MRKEQLREKLIHFQKQLIDLNTEISVDKVACQEQREGLFLELVALLDAFENIFAAMAEKEPSSDKSTLRVLNSFQAIQRKLLRTLEERGVTTIELPDNKAQMGLCHIIETHEAVDQEEGTILTTVRTGYRYGEKILRPVEVITVSNKNRGIDG